MICYVARRNLCPLPVFLHTYHLLLFVVSSQVTKCYFDDGFYDTNVYIYSDLTYGHTVLGPAIIIDDNRY